MDYPCGKFGDCSFSRFGSVVRTDTHTDADERYTPTTLVGVSNYSCAPVVAAEVNHEWSTHAVGTSAQQCYLL